MEEIKKVLSCFMAKVNKRISDYTIYVDNAIAKMTKAITGIPAEVEKQISEIELPSGGGDSCGLKVYSVSQLDFYPEGFGTVCVPDLDPSKCYEIIAYNANDYGVNHTLNLEPRDYNYSGASGVCELHIRDEFGDTLTNLRVSIIYREVN